MSDVSGIRQFRWISQTISAHQHEVVSEIRQPDSWTLRLLDMSADKTSSWTGNKTYKTTQSGRPSGFQTCQLVRLLVSQAIIHFRHIS